ncbi:hypothetical protein SVAN01_04789 [Stagonosporopsis vannaccii]|nr:hypothetical protein SVAN01_04789 [Stagonosporopsis vannaccii]
MLSRLIQLFIFLPHLSLSSTAMATNNTTTTSIKPFTLASPPGKDIWRKAPSHNAFSAPTHPSPLPVYPLQSFQRARLSFTLPPASSLRQYDQAGLLLHLTKPGVPDDKTKWIKTGIEWYYGKPYLSTVGCDAWADWSIVPLPGYGGGEERPGATIEVVREKDVLGKSLWVYAIVQGEGGAEERIPLREVNWIFADEDGWSVGVGGMVARPNDEGEGELVAEFEHGVEIEVLQS